MEKLIFIKSKDEAMQLKNSGNIHFKRHENSKALECYTKAILLAPYNIGERQQFLQKWLKILKRSSSSKNKVSEFLYSTEIAAAEGNCVESNPLLSQCFGNRSAVLYEMEKYDECLSDIHRAMELGFPLQSVHKLHKRREKCQLAQAKSKKNGSHDEVTHLKSCSAFESDAISVVSNPQVGKHMRATRDIRAGEVLFAEKPYAAFLYPGFLTTHCSYCFKESLCTILPCILCPLESYCSLECREKAWVQYHWMECKSLSPWRKSANWMEIMCLRIILRASPIDVWNRCKGVQVKCKEKGYELIYNLIPHEDKFPDDRQQYHLTMMAAHLYQHFGRLILGYIMPDCSVEDVALPAIDFEKKYQSESVLLRKLFLRHLLQLRCNSHGVNQVVRKLEELQCENETGDVMDALEEVKLGTVVYPTASLVNHSCSCSAFHRYVGNTTLLCVTKDLKKGDEISCSYGPQVGRMKTAQRKKALSEQYFFDCCCAACTSSDPALLLAEAAMDGFACLKCSTGALEQVTSASDKEIEYVCCHCKVKLSSKDLSTQIELKKRAEELLVLATKGEMKLDLLLKCQKIQASILHKFNLDLAGTNDLVAQLYASQGDFKLSSQFLEPSCHTVGIIYGENSLQYANELQKLASIFFHCERMEKALTTAEKAKTLLSLYHGTNHKDCKQLGEMILTLKSLQL